MITFPLKFKNVLDFCFEDFFVENKTYRKYRNWLDMLTHDYNSSYLEIKRIKFCRIPSEPKSQMWWHSPLIPTTSNT
jgi:hypothetical protein